MRRFERRRVIDAVACHRNDFALAFQRFDDQHFLLGADAGKEHFRAVEDGLQLGARHAAQRFTEDDARPGTVLTMAVVFPPDQPDFAGDGQRGMRMVAGDHDDLDARRTTARNRLGHLGPRRVVEADQSRQHHPRLARRLPRFEPAIGERQHAQPDVGHVLLGLDGTMPLALPERFFATIQFDAVAQGDDRLRRALAVQPAFAALLDDDRHAPALVVERQFADDAHVRIGHDLRGKLDQRGFHRIAEPFHLAFANAALEAVTGRGIMQKPGHSRFVEQMRVVVQASVQIHEMHGHAILRQRAGLVAADHRRRAECLDRRQMADQRVTARHALRGHGQR